MVPRYLLVPQYQVPASTMVLAGTVVLLLKVLPQYAMRCTSVGYLRNHAQSWRPDTKRARREVLRYLRGIRRRC